MPPPDQMNDPRTDVEQACEYLESECGSEVAIIIARHLQEVAAKYGRDSAAEALDEFADYAARAAMFFDG